MISDNRAAASESFTLLLTSSEHTAVLPASNALPELSLTNIEQAAILPPVDPEELQVGSFEGT